MRRSVKTNSERAIAASIEAPQRSTCKKQQHPHLLPKLHTTSHVQQHHSTLKRYTQRLNTKRDFAILRKLKLLPSRAIGRCTCSSRRSRFHPYSNQAHSDRHAEYPDHENTSQDQHLITKGRPSRDERLCNHQHPSGGSDSDRGAHYPSSLDIKQRTACYREDLDQRCLSLVEQRFNKRQKAADRMRHGLASAPTSKKDRDAGYRSPHFNSALNLRDSERSNEDKRGRQGGSYKLQFLPVPSAQNCRKKSNDQELWGDLKRHDCFAHLLTASRRYKKIPSRRSLSPRLTA